MTRPQVIPDLSLDTVSVAHPSSRARIFPLSFSPSSRLQPTHSVRMGSTYSKFGVDVPFDPELSLVTSPVYSPSLLAIIRLLVGTYYLVTFIFWFSWESVHSPVDVNQLVHVQTFIRPSLTRSTLRFFSYFTHLSAIGLCAYFWAAGVQTAAYARWKKYPLRYWPQSFQWLHLWLSATIVTFRMFAYGTRRPPRKNSSSFSSLCCHHRLLGLTRLVHFFLNAVQWYHQILHTLYSAHPTLIAYL
jgi:hypothetical protein